MFGNPTEFGVRPERREPLEERSLALGAEGTLLSNVGHREPCAGLASRRLMGQHPLSAAMAMASAALPAKYIGTGASRISEPLPALYGSVEPA